MKNKMNHLEEMIKRVQSSKQNITDVSRMWRDDVLFGMEELRSVVDTIEAMVDSSIWPMPTYVDLLFGI